MLPSLWCSLQQAGRPSGQPALTIVLGMQICKYANIFCPGVALFILDVLYSACAIVALALFAAAVTKIHTENWFYAQKFRDPPLSTLYPPRFLILSGSIFGRISGFACYVDIVTAVWCVICEYVHSDINSWLFHCLNRCLEHTVFLSFNTPGAIKICNREIAINSRVGRFFKFEFNIFQSYSVGSNLSNKESSTFLR